MKKGYFETSLFLLLVYFGWKHQLVMARHAHQHRPQNFGDCYQCPPGYGVDRHCNRHHDTECTACAPDHYSSHYSSRRPCYPCSRCGFGLYVAHRCTASKDTVCDSCHTYKGPHNEDFYERCVKPLLGTVVPDGNGTNDFYSQSGVTKENQSVSSIDMGRGVPSTVIILSGIAIGTLAVILVVTCFVVSTRRHCKKVDRHYPYEAVATQEAVML